VLVGGDVTRSRDVTISVTVFGALDGRAPVRRSGAGPEQVVALVGRTGWAAAGMAVLQRGFRSPRAVVEAQRVPEVPYGQGAVAADAGATAMIDVSDGLLADVGHVATDSGVAVDVWTRAFEIDEPLQAVGSALGVDPMQFLLGGGDDHCLAATFPVGVALPEGFRQIGTVADGEGVTVDGAAYEGPTGWTHF
jgi:thiamine-monophosphate kinase